MMLYVNGSDIGHVVLGALNDDRSRFVIDPVSYDSSPEACLETIDVFLTKYSEHPLTGIAAVLGPGSATALRTSLAIVNTLGFTKGIPLYGVTLDAGADDRTVLVDLHRAQTHRMLRPVYAHAARITPSNKDALGRTR